MTNWDLITATQRADIQEFLDQQPAIFVDAAREFPGVRREQISEALARRLQYIRMSLSWTNRLPEPTSLIMHAVLPDYHLLFKCKPDQPPLIYDPPAPMPLKGLETWLMRRFTRMLDQEMGHDDDRPLLQLDCDEFTVFIFHMRFTQRIMDMFALNSQAMRNQM